jgi:hypothetical protein
LGLRTSGAAAHFVQLANASAKNGTLTVHARIKRGLRWVLQAEYAANGQTASFSGLTTRTVS